MSLYVDRLPKNVTINTNPQGVYVWDSTGQKLLGQTPMSFMKQPRDYATNTLFLTQNGFHSETVYIYNPIDGFGFGILDAVVVVPWLIDLITWAPGYGKFKGTTFNVNMIPTSIPRPDAEATAYAQQQAVQAQAMIDATNTMTNAINQAGQTIQSTQTRTYTPPPTSRPTPAPAKTSPQRTVTPTTPNFKRFCPRTYKSGVVHGEWDSRFSAGCPACRGTINW